MEKKDIIEFFDRCAPTWDENMVRREDVIAAILDAGGIQPGVHVLDVACGTGVLFPDYLSRGAASVTGIDISPEMVRLARKKFPDVQVICGDGATALFPRKFDAVMVYNAFPHFPDPGKLLEHLASALNPGGRLTVAHGMSRAQVNQHHSGCAAHVSLGLMPADKLAGLLAPWFEVDVILSDQEKYIVSGCLRAHPHPVERETAMEHHHHHSPDEKKRQLNRISRAIGHLQHVKSMMESDSDCADVLIQLAAVRSALNNLGKEIINEHISHCIAHAVAEGDTQAIQEFQEAIKKFI